MTFKGRRLSIDNLIKNINKKNFKLNNKLA